MKVKRIDVYGKYGSSGRHVHPGVRIVYDVDLVTELGEKLKHRIHTDVSPWLDMNGWVSQNEWSRYNDNGKVEEHTYIGFVKALRVNEPMPSVKEVIEQTKPLVGDYMQAFGDYDEAFKKYIKLCEENGFAAKDRVRYVDVMYPMPDGQDEYNWPVQWQNPVKGEKVEGTRRYRVSFKPDFTKLRADLDSRMEYYNKQKAAIKEREERAKAEEPLRAQRLIDEKKKIAEQSKLTRAKNKELARLEQEAKMYQEMLSV